MKTFINWPGNKSKHINKFEKYIPDEIFEDWSGTYIEPFIGSGALLLYIEPDRWIINDLNKDLINVWQSVMDEPKKIITKFKLFGKTFKPLSKDKKLELCRKRTKKIEGMKNNTERAIEYLLMKFCAYMGNILLKNKFYFTSLNSNIYPNESYTFLSEIMHNNLINVSKYLNESKGKIYNKDYKLILEKAKKGDFVFLDPPYIEIDKYQLNYNKNVDPCKEFVIDLLKQVKKLDKIGAKWMMTQTNTKLIRETFSKYKIKSFNVYRGFTRKTVKELVIMNY